MNDFIGNWFREQFKDKGALHEPWEECDVQNGYQCWEYNNSTTGRLDALCLDTRKPTPPPAPESPAPEPPPPAGSGENLERKIEIISLSYRPSQFEGHGEGSVAMDAKFRVKEEIPSIRTFELFNQSGNLIEKKTSPVGTYSSNTNGTTFVFDQEISEPGTYRIRFTITGEDTKLIDQKSIQFTFKGEEIEDKPTGGKEPEEIKPEPISEGVQPRNYSPIGTLTLSPTQNTVNFQWYGVKGAKKYRVMIDDVPRSDKHGPNSCGGSYTQHYFCTASVPNVNGGAGSDGVSETGRFPLMLANTPLEVDKTYKWWVDALDENGNPVSNNATSVGKTFTVQAENVISAKPLLDQFKDQLGGLTCAKHDGDSYPQCGNTIGLEGKDPTHVYTVIPRFDCNNKPAGFKHVDGGVSADCQKPAEAPAAGSPTAPGAPAECETGPVGVSLEQANCILEKGPSNITEFFRQNGWCVQSEAHKRMIANHWYNILAPQADHDKVKAACFPGAAANVTRTTKGFRISESATSVSSAPLIPYQEGQGGVEYTYPLSSSANGPYYLYIVFYDQDEKAINLTPYTLLLIKESPSSGEPLAPPPPVAPPPFVPAPPPPPPSGGATGSCTMYASPKSGSAPLPVLFQVDVQNLENMPESKRSEWDLDGDGSFEIKDDIALSKDKIYNQYVTFPQTFSAGFRVVNGASILATCSTSVTLIPGISPPTSPTSPTAPPPPTGIYNDGYERPDD